MSALETYLRNLSEIRSSRAAVRETSYYSALADYLDEIGKTLKPKVRSILQLRNQGAGIPDGGLFPTDQLRGLEDDEDPLQLPLQPRAVLEVKGPDDDLGDVIKSVQVAKYLERYGLVLVTNYRAFQLVKAGPGSKPEILEGYTLAEDARSFWAMAAHPRKAAETHAEPLADYLKRVMLASAPLTTPQSVAWFLASYARAARARVEAGDLKALAAIRTTLEETLGLTFEGEKGDHFFRSTLVQTLFYGIFSAWVLWHEENPGRTDAFDWRWAAHYLRVPVIQALFEEVADARKLRALGLLDVLHWAGATLGRVDRPAFFASFERGHAVQYFYEPFLEAFDPVLRKDLGVWYTPPEVVQYMVARVDTVLRQELNIADGLADPRVLVLDPCAGTGAYLVEVLNRIRATLHENGEGALLALAVKRAALERVFGFELLPAPYVVAHLQLGLLLQKLGAPLAEGERAAMYLTNSLTGWEPPQEPKTQLPLFQELAAERDAAEKVKREARILVVLGNPPYNAFAGTSPAEEAGLVEAYKEGLNSRWGIKKYNVDDLYVRFFRLAERRIAEQTGLGVVCYISNFSYLSDPSFVVLRQRLLREFDALWFDSLNGDSRETGKLTPDGKPDPSIFSTEYNREGIRVGTAIGLLVRREVRAEAPVVRFRQFWGVAKRADLSASLSAPRTDFDATYEPAVPNAGNRFEFRPSGASEEYLAWPRLSEFWSEPPSNGLMEKRGGALIDIDRAQLESRMKVYYDKAIAWDVLHALSTGLTINAARYDAREARKKLLSTESFNAERLRRYALRPFDTRWCYYSATRPLWNEPRPNLWAQCWNGNSFVLSRFKRAKSPEGAPFYFSSLLSDDHCLTPDAVAIPIRLRASTDQSGSAQLILLGDSPIIRANLSASARRYLGDLGISDPDTEANATLVWMHVLAIGFSPCFLQENGDGIAQDWPRIALPNSRQLLEASAGLGKQIAALLDTEKSVVAVTSGAIRSELKSVAVVAGPLPLNLSIIAGWGSGGKGSPIMPGHGKRVTRAPQPEELVPGLGETTHDVYLNEDTYWRNIPDRVWEYRIGGYQVIKKWLSYREADLLGRPITQDEAREVRDMARRIAAILLLEPELDANYAAVKAAAYAWPGV